MKWLWLGITLLFPFSLFSLTLNTLSQAGVINYQVATDLFGNQTAVWTRNIANATIVEAATKAAGSETWVLEGALSDSRFTVNDFVLVMDELGNAVVAWQLLNGNLPTSSFVVQASVKPVGGHFTPPGDPRLQPNLLSPLGYSVNSNVVPSVATSGGNIVIAWRIYNVLTTDPFTIGNNVVQAAYLKAGGTFQTPGVPTRQQNILSPLRFDVMTMPSAAIDIAGNALVAWATYNGTSNTFGTIVAQQAIRASAATVWTPAGDPRFQSNILSTLGVQVIADPAPIALIGAGNASVTWLINTNNGNVLQASSFIF